LAEVDSNVARFLLTVDPDKMVAGGQGSPVVAAAKQRLAVVVRCLAVSLAVRASELAE
jgi:hypothetical protein